MQAKLALLTVVAPSAKLVRSRGIIISNMNKRALHHVWTRLRKVSYWHFLIACLACAVIFIFAVRQNNLRAIQLRDEVLKVDQQNGDTETALKNLREYMYSHMNTDLSSKTSVYPPIQLKYRYERLVAAEKAKVAELNNNTIYNDAQKYCETNFPQSFYGAGRLPCIQNYIDTHPATNVTEQAIPDALYKFNFASPSWSPDIAGWSLVLTGLFFLLFVIRFGLEKWLRHEFKHHL